MGRDKERKDRGKEKEKVGCSLGFGGVDWVRHTRKIEREKKGQRKM